MDAATPPRSNTPYLDRELKIPSQNANYATVRWWQGAALGLCLIVETSRIFLFLWIIVVLTHELGHLVGALVAGHRFEHIRIGPFQLAHPHQVTWHWTWGSMFSGATYALPLARSGLRWRTFLFVFAGPAANLLSAIFVVKVAPQNGLMAVAISKLFIGASFVVGVANLIPFQRRGQMSDGMQLWILLFSKARTERLITMVTLVADYRQGKQISSLADYPMEKWSADNDGTSQYVVANWLAYHQSSDDQIASQHLEACLSGCSAVDPAFRSRLIVQAAEHQALRRKRLDIAREWLGSLKPREREFEVYRVQALVLQQENDFEAAAATVEQAIDYIESLPEEKTRAVRLLSLKNLKVELDKQIAHKT